MLKVKIEKQFGVNSTRPASTSAAKSKRVPMVSIIKTAGWSNAKLLRSSTTKRTERESSSIISVSNSEQESSEHSAGKNCIYVH